MITLSNKSHSASADEDGNYLAQQTPLHSGPFIIRTTRCVKEISFKNIVHTSDEILVALNLPLRRTRHK